MANKLPTWYWVVAVVALLWNLMGVLAFVGQVAMTDELLSTLPQAQQDLFNATPSWINIVFGVAVIAGTLGCIALLIRKKWAKPLFVLSFIAVLIQNSYSLFATNAMEVYGAGQAIAMPLLVIIFGAFLIWHTQENIRKGCLS